VIRVSVDVCVVHARDQRSTLLQTRLVEVERTEWHGERGLPNLDQPKWTTKTDRPTRSAKVVRPKCHGPESRGVLGYKLENLSSSVTVKEEGALMITRQFTRYELQQAFTLAFVLHPSPEVALRVLTRACDLMIALEQNEARRQRSVEHYKSPIPPKALLQFAVYCASYEWEMDQEGPLPKKSPKYKPTRDDLVVRYLKHLVWNNLLKANFSSLGIGLGCSLYNYKPKQIADLLELSDELSIRRIKRSINKQLMKRFRYAEVLTPKGNAIRTTLASDEDRELVQQALKAFTPWNTTHIPLEPKQSLLEKLFDDKSKLTDWDRKHALLDPECGGLARLIIQHNNLFARYREDLDDPNLRLFVPDFEWSPTPPVDRFQAPRLTDNEIFFLNERLKSRGPRACNVDGLLSDLHDGEVDESLIRVFDYWASSTNESPPSRVLSHGSIAKRSKAWIPFEEERGNAMGCKIRILMLAANPWTMPSVSLTGPDVYLRGSNWHGNYEDIFFATMLRESTRAFRVSTSSRNYCPEVLDQSYYRCQGGIPIDAHITYESLRVLSWKYRGIVCSITGWNFSVPNDILTVWDFIKRSISDDLTQPLTSRDPFANTCWVDDRKPKPHVSHLLLVKSFHNRRHRPNSYKDPGACDVLLVSGRDQQSPKIVFLKANRHRTRDQLIVTTFHSMEQEQLKDLKFFLPNKGSLISDWYDRASALKIVDRLRCSRRMGNEIDGLNRWFRPWGESSLPLLGMNSSANRETNTDVR
jgi:hypothetical protein